MPGFLFDHSVWVAFSFPEHPYHAAALAAIKRASAAQPVAVCRITQLSVLRLFSTPTVFEHYGAVRITNVLALEMVDRILRLPHVVERSEPPGLMSRLRQLAALPSASPKVWMDAYLAAFALTDALTLVTLDKDFADFGRHGLDCQVLTAAPGNRS